MQLTEQAIKEYQDIFFKVKGKKISKDEALRQGSKLVLLVQIVSKKSNSDSITDIIK